MQASSRKTNNSLHSAATWLPKCWILRAQQHKQQIYECLRQIIEAIALKEGFKVYSHEAYTHYLKDKKEISIAEKFDRYRKLRNGINYYGKAVTTQITKEAIYQINKIIEKLKDKYV